MFVERLAPRYDSGPQYTLVLERRQGLDSSSYRRRTATSARPPVRDIDDLLSERPNYLELQLRPPPRRVPSRRMSQSSSPKRAPSEFGVLLSLHGELVSRLWDESVYLASHANADDQNDPRLRLSQELGNVAFGLNVWLNEARLPDLTAEDVDPRVVGVTRNVLESAKGRLGSVLETIDSSRTKQKESSAPSWDQLEQTSDDEDHAALP